MAGENCTMSIPGHSRNVRLLTLAFGLTVVADGDSARTKRTMYTRAWTQDTFVATVTFTSLAERDDFTNWCSLITTFICDPNNGVGPVPVRVTYAPRGFDMTGILESGIIIQNSVGQATWPLALNFVGAQDASLSYVNVSSSFAQGGDPTSAYFYPGGKQLSVGQASQDALYNDPNFTSDGGNIIGGIFTTPGGAKAE